MIQAQQNQRPQAPGMQQGIWTILDEVGRTALTFTSFLTFDLSTEGKALNYPVEEGGFANYNKVRSPRSIAVTLGVQGSELDFDSVLKRLDEYQTGAIKLAVSTPSTFYKNMTLESYSYTRTQDNGAGMLVVELSLVEVREVRTQVTTTVITKPKNPTSASSQNVGLTQTIEVVKGSRIYKAIFE